MKLKRFIFPSIALAALICVCLYSSELGGRVLRFTGRSFLTFLISIPPIFLLIGLLDVWVDRDRMMRLMGDGSAIRGIAAAFAFGIVTAVPLYALFPVAGIMLKKRCGIRNVMIFICSSAGVRIPLLLFEISYLGWTFTTARLIGNVMVVLGISWAIDSLITEKDRQLIYSAADGL